MSNERSPYMGSNHVAGTANRTVDSTDNGTPKAYGIEY